MVVPFEKGGDSSPKPKRDFAGSMPQKLPFQNKKKIICNLQVSFELQENQSHNQRLLPLLSKSFQPILFATSPTLHHFRFRLVIMPWSCYLCTFENPSDEAIHCEMCGSKNEQRQLYNASTSAAVDDGETGKSTERKRISNPQRKSPQQLTLFGKPVSKSSLISKPKKSSKTQSNMKPSSSSSRRLSSKAKTTALNLSVTSARTAPVSKSRERKSHQVQEHTFSFHVRTKPPSSQEISDTLKRVFRLDKLRTLQEKVITTALQPSMETFNKSSNPTSQLVVLATGGGKSLCYQLPACVLGGVTIVISPLIALMKDQVLGLENRKIPAACLCSANTEKQNNATLDRLFPKQANSDSNTAAKFFGSKDESSPKSLTLLYITPESIQTDRMRRVLHRLNDEKRLAMFAVDEAHCLSR